ncbi:MAG: bifunctional pyr operon transcriptional regulator/uracil phosphoribosyltransferase PyrR [Planctomycetes bacterium]|nr:bifunctional pyr operon transcriptional regulator/uracil phosphoribosyltransferase PyrR [Planctomycetota bacterium]
MKQLLDADAVAEAMDDLYGAMMAGIPAEAPLAMIGVHTRGDVIARRLAARLAEERDAPFDQGVLDITFYRDDLAQRERAPLVRTTTMNFDLDDKLVVLVDDVLHTGRSVRAAMDAIMDFGRPMAIRLAVLIDRGGRELPIAADFVGRRLDVPDDVRVQVHVRDHDAEDGVYLMKRSH